MVLADQKLRAASIFYFLWCAYCSPIFGQGRITGKISNALGEPLPFANVLLLKATDSTFVKGEIANDQGNFVIASIAKGQYYVVTTMVGFKKTFSSVYTFAGNEILDLGTFSLEEDATHLNEVVIQAEKPLFEQRIDRLVVNVENSVTSAGGTALEVLERSPGVNVNKQSNSISLSGKQGILVMFNGKVQRLPMTAIMQLLAGMPANTIERIELINNPSAKYDAQGDAGIINIVMKQDLGLGTSGSASASFGYGYYAKTSGSFNINHRGRNFGIYANYAGVYNKFYQRFSFNRSLFYPDQQVITESRRIALAPTHRAGIGTEWNVNKKTTINTLVSGFDDVWDMNANNESFIRQSGLDSSSVLLNDKEVNHWKNVMANINLVHVFNDKATLNFDGDYLYYVDDNPHTFVNDFHFIQTNSFRQDQIKISKKTPINLGIIKLDFEKSIQKLKLEMGGKLTFSRLKNDVLVENLEKGIWIIDQLFSQNYRMKDDAIAAYVNTSSKLTEKSQFQLGLRTEHTDMEIKTVEQESVFDLDFWSLFPSAFYQYQLDKNNAINFSYGRRITRPSYEEIAPFVIFMDPFNYFSGNPQLKPTITNAIQGSYVYKEVIFAMKYSHDKNAIAPFQSKVDPVSKRTFYYSENLDLVQTVSSTITLPLTFAKWFKNQNNITGFYQKINTLFQNVPIAIDRISFQLNSTFTFTLPKNYVFEVTTAYSSPSQFGISYSRSLGNISAGLQKTLKNNGTLSLNINDIFWTNYYRSEINNEDLNQNQRNTYYFGEPRVVRLTYSINFGSNAVKRKVRTTASEEERTRLKQ